MSASARYDSLKPKYRPDERELTVVDGGVERTADEIRNRDDRRHPDEGAEDRQGRDAPVVAEHTPEEVEPRTEV